MCRVLAPRKGCFSILWGLWAALSGCASFDQRADQVLVRDPVLRSYGEPLPARPAAEKHWEYAVMSENAYREGRASLQANRTEFTRALQYTSGLTEGDFNAACADDNQALPLRGWRLWGQLVQFPSEALQHRMSKKGLYLEVLEREAEPHTIAVVFEGTNFFQLRDLAANLHWFLRFIPGVTDQYTVTAEDVAAEFLQRIRARPDRYSIGPDGALRTQDGKPIRIVAVGHSLGGGLAQHFAYTFPQQKGVAGPKVAEVFAFNTSPVTGWFSAADPPRSYNAEGLVVHRIFEHGEVLAYLRLLTSRLAVSTANPAIWEHRYNFDAEAHIVRNHSMRRLACGLTRAARPWQPN